MENSKTETTKEVERCIVCTSVLKWVEVHGHYQCVTCKAVLYECCTGEKAEKVNSEQT